MLSENKINLNFANFVSRLEKYNAYTDKFKGDVEFNDKLKNASAFTSEDSGGAYKGSLIEHITRITMIAFNINETMHADVKVPADSLVRVCFLHQIAKAQYIVENLNDWEIKKGKPFTFSKSLPAVKVAEYSVYLCNKYGIELLEDEYEAILSVDKSDDDQTKYFSNSLSQILRSAIELANTEKRLRYKLNKVNK